MAGECPVRTGVGKGEKLVAVVSFPLKRVKALLAKARRAAEPTEVEEGLGLGLLDGLKVLGVFSPLRLRKGWRMITQQYSDGYNSSGFTWAVPVDGPRPDLFLTKWPDESTRPEGAVATMAVVEGDGTPWSYVCASLLGRELAELGAEWHGCDWSAHELHGGAELRGGEWTVVGPRPGSYAPSVSLGEEGVTVTFWTYSGLGQERIVCHTDFFRAGGGYEFEATARVIAHGPGGYVF